MSQVRYKDFIINANSHQLVENSRWSLDVTISRDHGDRVVTVPVSTVNTFATEEEATRQCLEFGRAVIDGEVEGCSVDSI